MIKIIYISGYGRSGSTLLDIVLSSEKDIIGTGELCNILNHYQDNLFKNDSFWKDIVEKSISPLEIKTMEKYRFLFETVFIGFMSKYLFPRAYQQYKTYLSKIFHNINQASSCSIVIDSSKTAWRQFHRPNILYDIFRENLYVIHLKRDLRDVKRSMKKGDNLKIMRKENNPKMLFPSLRSLIGVNLSYLFYFLNFNKLQIVFLNYCNFTDNPEFYITKIQNRFNISFNYVIHKIQHKEPFYSSKQFSGNRLKDRPITEIVPCQ